MALCVHICREFEVKVGDRKSAVYITADLMDTKDYEIWISKNGDKAKQFFGAPYLINHDLQTQMAMLEILAEQSAKINEIISIELIEQTIQVTINEEIKLNETTIQKRKH